MTGCRLVRIPPPLYSLQALIYVLNLAEYTPSARKFVFMFPISVSLPFIIFADERNIVYVFYCESIFNKALFSALVHGGGADAIRLRRAVHPRRDDAPR